MTETRVEGKPAPLMQLVRVRLTALPLGHMPIGYWWISTSEVVKAQLQEALAVRRGLHYIVDPITGAGPELEAAALEMVSTFSYFLDQLREDLVEAPFVEQAYATREDPTGRRAALAGALLCAGLIGGDVREEADRFSVIIRGEIEPEAVFLLAAPLRPVGTLN